MGKPSKIILFWALLLPCLPCFGQGSFSCPDTLHLHIEPLLCEWTVEDFSHLANPDDNATFIQSPSVGTVLSISEVWDFEINLTLITPDQSEANCSFVARISPEQTQGENNQWLVSCYNGKKIYNQEIYRGFYTNDDLNIVSWWLWDTGTSPSAYSEYQGCNINDNHHTVSYSRTGFPCAEYALDILNHDNEVQVFIDGDLVFEDFGYNLQHDAVYEGFLDETSTVTFEWNEGIGGSLGILDFRMICPEDTTILLDENCSIEMPDFRHEACSGGTVTQSVPPGTSLSQGVFPVSIYTSDINGQQDSCSFNVSVIDQTPPFFVCPEETELSTDENCQAQVPDFSNLEGVDNCDGFTTVTQSIAPGQSIYENTTLILTSADASGNQTECEVQLILNDSHPPSYPCPDDDIIIVNDDCSWSMPNYTFMRFPADNCSSDFNVTQTPSPGTIYNSSQEVQVEISVDDTSGNQTFCNFTVLAYDLNTPVISCIEDQEIEVSNMCNALLPDFTPQISYSGTCAEVELIQIPEPGAIITQSGEPILVEIEARSSNGTSATCLFNYTVIDNEAVSITCENSSVSANENCLAIIPDLSHNLYVSNECNAPQVTQFPLAGELVEMNNTPIEVEFTIIDESGNSSSCVSLLIIEDNSPPQLSCSTDSYELYVNENGIYTVENFTSELEIEENCSVPIDIDQWPIQGDEIQDLGTHEIEFSVEDSSGNQNSCQISIEVIDTISPTIAAVETVEISIDTNCGFLLPDITGYFTFSDNHSEILVATQSPNPGTYFGSKTDNEFTIQVEDESGNTSSFQGIITFIDAIAPTISCNESIELALNQSCQAAMPDMQEHVLFTDNCDSDISFVQSIQAGSLLEQDHWPSEVVVDISDEAGNSSQCTINLLAIDSISPQIICPEGGVFSANDNCIAELNLGQPEVSDYCSEVTYELVGGNDPNGEFEIGTYYSEYQAIDTQGNTVVCSVQFIVTDSIPPTLNCADPIQISLNESCEIASPSMDPEALVECSDVTWLQTSGPEPGDLVGIGIHELVYSAHDEAGNTAECSTQLTVIDVSVPELFCPENQQINALDNLCGVYFEYDVSASDNCSYELIQVNGDISGTFLPLGTHQFGFEISDPSGNSSTCSFQLEVIDNTAPIIECIETLFLSSANENISIPHAVDACSEVVVSALGDWPPSYPLESGVQEFEFLAVDEAGNLSTCVTTVQVNAAPIARTDRITSFKRTEELNVLENDEDPDGPFVLLNHTEYPSYVQHNIDGSFTIFLEDLDCKVDTFTYQIRDIDGLTATGLVIINPLCPYNIELPQVFTPNSDGSNDLFVIEHLEDFQDNELQIFNEAGQRVFHQYNYQNSWDGKASGFGTLGSGRLPQGTYYVILHLAAFERPLKGALTIVY